MNHPVKTPSLPAAALLAVLSLAAGGCGSGQEEVTFAASSHCVGGSQPVQLERGDFAPGFGSAVDHNEKGRLETRRGLEPA